MSPTVSSDFLILDHNNRTLEYHFSISFSVLHGPDMESVTYGFVADHVDLTSSLISFENVKCEL